MLVDERPVDPADKERQRQRYARYMKKHVGYEEEKQRKVASRRRRAERSDESPRRRGDWSEDEDTFEKIAKTRDRVEPIRRELDPDLPRATVVAVHHGRVELDNGEQARLAPHLAVDPTMRLAVGDVVAVSSQNNQSRVEGILERRTRLSRPDPGNPSHELVIAANVDIAVVVVSVHNPPLHPGLIDRFLIALDRGGVEPLVCVNKCDLLKDPADREQLQQEMAVYRDLGFPVLLCSTILNDGLDELRQQLDGKTCVFVGHSGVGKSSILNALDPEGERRIGEVRDYDGKGRHTTSSSSLRNLGDGTRVIDTPGVRSFGLWEMDARELQASFPEFSTVGGRCRFGNCSHRQEPDCAVREAVGTGKLPRTRYESYLRILESLD